MGILDELQTSQAWFAYLEYRKNKPFSSERGTERLEAYIRQEAYRDVVHRISLEGGAFSLPTKVVVRKIASDKLRIAYRFAEEEVPVAQMINYLLSRYDERFSSGCYSYRMKRGVKDVVHQVLSIPGWAEKYTIKADIKNYGSSVRSERLASMICAFLYDDPKLADVLCRLVVREQVLWNGTVVSEQTGVLSGSGLNGFFSNLYLTDVDEAFVQRGIPYFRYGDDILIFADSAQAQAQYLQELLGMLEERGLAVNPEKVHLTVPGERWDYLGFACVGGKVDLASFTVTKAKKRIRCAARQLYMKRKKQGLTYEETVKQFLDYFDAVFYGVGANREFAWNRWYFSFLTTDAGLKQVDQCMQQYIRYLYSGRHYKGNYKITYQKMKEMGYRSLVHEYYLYLKNGA